MRKLIWIAAACWLAAASQGQCANAVPLFQFQVFYQNDMEIAPGAPMTIGGAVHGNANIYLQPQSGLTFSNIVSAVGQIVLGESPLDPTTRTPSPVTFDDLDLSGVNPLNLPVNNSIQNGYGILEPPQAGETPNSATGMNLLYNKADMIIIISSNNTISVTSGAGIDNQATVISSNQWQTFLSTNGTFYDQRDSLTVYPMVLNVSNLVIWSATNTVLRPVLSSLRGSGEADVQSIYVADFRGSSNAVITTNVSTGTHYSTDAVTTADYPADGTYVPPITSTNTTVTTTTSLPAAGTYVGTITTNLHPHSYTYNLIVGYTYNAIVSTPYTNTTYVTNWPAFSQPGILLSNGAGLPPQGLSVATPDPAYVIGNWNIKTNFSNASPSDAGLADTSQTHPSAIFADAITVLSPAWNPANSAGNIGSRIAASDTVNAAFFSGNVPSNGEYYSGGLENFPRLLENWSGDTFTWNGSMCCMFDSQIATGPWPNTGAVYNPPTRNWAFDTNFNNPATLPPLTPLVETSAPAMQVVAETNGAILLSWSARPGVSYTVQYKTNSTQENWCPLATVIASGASASLSDPATNTQRFYRLQTVP